MALDNKRKKAIQDAAKAKSEEIDSQAEASQFEKDYVEVMSALNEALEETLDEYASSSIRILRDSYQFRPQSVLLILKEQEDRLRDLAQAIIGCIEPIRDSAFREHTAKCVKTIVDVCSKSIDDQNTRTLNRVGKKLQ